jgi:hypothetical protein
MQLIAGISILLLIVVSAVIGIRLVQLWRGTRQRPELYLGLMLILVMVLGYPLFIVARLAEQIGFRAAWASLTFAGLSVNAGLVFLYLFTWKTFRPDSRWCACLVGVASCALAVNVVGVAIDTWAARSVYVDFAEMPLWRVICNVFASGAAYTWTAVESFRYHTTLRKRQKLGLADPLVTNRLWLWCQLSMVILVVIVVNDMASLRSIDVLTTPWIMASTSLGGILQAAYLFLIFLPPQRYRAWVQGGAAAEGT